MKNVAGLIWPVVVLAEDGGCAEARQIREKYRLQGILTEVNCNIGVLSARRLAMVTVPALMGNTFVIKAHSSPTSGSRLLQRMGLLRTTYIYRDPRDAMLSAYDYGQRALQKGRPNAFSHLTDFQKSLDFILEYVHADRGHILLNGKIYCYGHPQELLADIKKYGYEECAKCQR